MRRSTNIFFSFLQGLPVVVFWSAVLSFIPVTFYLLVKNPPLYRAEGVAAKGIFIIGQDAELKKEKKARTKIAAMIYGICFLLVSGVYLLNLPGGSGGVNPFDILSTLSVLFFWFSVLSYLPIAVYLFIQDPWQYKEEGICLTRIYKVYGLGILIFSVFFAVHWLRSRNFSLQTEEIFISLLGMFFSSLIVSYLPILLYIYLKKANPCRIKKIHPNVIFMIYSVCFLIFSVIYAYNWINDRRAGIVFESFRN